MENENKNDYSMINTQPSPIMTTSNIKAHVIRLLPAQDLYQELKKYLKENQINAAFIMTCVGSLKKINVRKAYADNYLKIEDKFEIVSLVGCVSIERCHVHISLSDVNGSTIGGHLMEEGNIVYTTAEVVLGELFGLSFTSEQCNLSGWPELKINKLENGK